MVASPRVAFGLAATTVAVGGAPVQRLTATVTATAWTPVLAV